MTLDEFAEITRQVISEHGFEHYIPTACYPGRQEINALTGLPPDLEPEKTALEWASESVTGNEEFLVAFKVDDTHFKIIRCAGPFSEDEIYAID